MIVQLQNQGYLSGIVAGTGLQKPQRRRISVAAGIDGQLEMIERIIAGRVGRKTPRRSMFESLVQSIPEHPAHFRDSHPIRMVYEAVRSRRGIGELRVYVLTRAQDWERLVIAWAFQRLLYEVSRSSAGMSEATNVSPSLFVPGCLGNRAVA